MTRIATAVLVALLAVKTTAPAVSLVASDWDYIAVSMPPHPLPLVGMSGWYFEFPDQDGVHYVTTPYRADVSGKTAVTMTVQTVMVDGAPTFDWYRGDNPCDTPASTRIMLERQGDKYYQPSYRWWSNPIHYDLDSFAVATVTTALTPDQWSNVYGVNGATIPIEFVAALQKLGNIGLTFGGGCFFGHGVWAVNGHARFILTNFQVQ